ncbi:ABC transporter ATP-binding protein [Nocardioides terrisoli]|uniref:ABC transporter ATP-binding protein n=1 Tax=Nocardioides terrisoli TaxID=3388267 RepID=UPI00287B9E6A|nr:ABC transporter ATP-binding protein [Nocardioides marmorisolisilvae]
MSEAPTSDPVIRTSGLRKVFRSPGQRAVVAVDGLDLTVAAGTVHGFLGPNGSGKTTTIRLLLGLARPTAGSIELFGQRVPAHLSAVVDRLGATVEEPAFTPGFTGRRNLMLLARTAGLPRRRVDEVLEQVGLRRHDRRRFGRYSLGMKQRLALAAALLRSPDLLILDEPGNGLDPAGVRDLRELVRSLADGGTTVLLSSHNLAEVQQICDDVSILSGGRLLATGPVDALIGERLSRTRVRVGEPDRAAEVLRAAGYEVSHDADALLVGGHEHPEDVTRILAGHDLFVGELSAVRPDLESYFLQLTGHPMTGTDEDGGNR